MGTQGNKIKGRLNIGPEKNKNKPKNWRNEENHRRINEEKY